VSPINYDTLLELYLRGEEDESHPETKEDKEKRLEKARKLLTESGTNGNSRFDQHHALVLCQKYDYDAGVLILLEKLKMSYEIIQTHMERHEYSQVILDCYKFGREDPNVWIQVLTYFATLDDEGDDQKYQKEIGEVLRNIQNSDLMSPLLVLQILSQKPSMPLSVVREYISECLQKERDAIDENQKQIDLMRRETAKFRSEIQELTTVPKVFQISKCTFCGNPLTLPAVHFMCMHSFHQHCLGENDRECPLCAASNHQTFDTKRSLEEKANEQAEFRKELSGNKDGFSIIAKYCGRCIFGCLNDDPNEATNESEPVTLPVAVPLPPM